MSLLRYYYDIRVGIILNIDVFELLKKNFYTPFNENIKLLRFFKNCEHHMHNNSFKIHGNSVIFLKTFLNLNFNYNISNYFFKTRQSVLTAMLLKNKNLAVFYNINAIYMEIYRLYIFFFNVGCVSGTFSTISHHVIYKDTESFNYFIQQRRGKGR